MRQRHILGIILSLSCGINALLFIMMVQRLALSDVAKKDNSRWPPRAAVASKGDDSHSHKGPRSFIMSSNNDVSTDIASASFEDIRGILVYPNALLPSYPRNVSELYDRVVPNNVFFVWCGKRVFEFHHYLSVLSVWYHLEPDVIEVLYESPPQEDKYNTWLSTLRGHIPALHLQPLPSYATKGKCGVTFGLELLLDRGGIFINEGVVLLSTLTPGLNFLLNAQIQMSFFPDKTIAWVAAVRKSPALGKYLKEYTTNGGRNNVTFEKLKTTFGVDNVSLSRCSHFESRATSSQPDTTFAEDVKNGGYDDHVICLHFKRPPSLKDILKDANSTFAMCVKSLLYENHRYSKEVPLKDGGKRVKAPIPLVVHYVWFGGKTLSFSMYLSFLSSVNIVRPTAVLIHTDLMLDGVYWTKIHQHPLVHVVYRYAPRAVFGHRVVYAQHRSDVVRADVLEKYGGIYLDWDAFWLKPVNDLLNPLEDVVLSRDHIPRKPFPDTINMGVALARPRSTFIRRWRSALINYRSYDFLYNAVELPYKIYETNPHSVNISDRLQVMCYFLKCHPSFHPKFKDWGRAQPFDWRKDVYAIHFTHPDPPAFHNETILTQSQGMFADIAEYIWNFELTKGD